MRFLTFVRTLCARGLLAGAAALLAAQGAWAQEPIRVGAFLSVTGPAAFLGDPELKTLELYVERLNAEGGVLGRKLQLVSYDDAGDAEKARTFVKRLIEQDKVDLIVGGSTTGATMAAVPLIEQAGVPFVSLAGAVVIVEPVKKWVFKTPHTDRMACEKIFVDLQARKITKVALISGSGGFDKSMRGECLKVAPKYSIEFVADETYGATDTDMTAQLSKIKGSGAMAVLNAGFGQGPAIVTRNYRQVGLTLPLYQSHGVASKEYVKLSGAAADGVRLPAAALLVAEQLAAGDAQKPVVVGYTQGLHGQVQGRRLDLRRACLRRPDAGGERDQGRRLDRQGQGARRARGDQGLRRHRRLGQHVGHRPHGAGPERVPHARGEERRVDAGELGLETDGACAMAGSWLQFIASGLTAGAIYALVALGFSIIYNASGAINFAQGEFVMIGGMSAVTLLALGLPLLVALPLAVLSAVIVALLIEKLAVEPARHAGTVTLIIITIGVALFLRGLAQVLWGKGVHRLPAFRQRAADRVAGRHARCRRACG